MLCSVFLLDSPTCLLTDVHIYIIVLPKRSIYNLRVVYKYRQYCLFFCSQLHLQSDQRDHPEPRAHGEQQSKQASNTKTQEVWGGAVGEGGKVIILLSICTYTLEKIPLLMICKLIHNSYMYQYLLQVHIYYYIVKSVAHVCIYRIKKLELSFSFSVLIKPPLSPASRSRNG